MKLGTVRIQDFQSIRDSNEFSVNDITCLVGKNEAGKTAILKALYRLNPVIAQDSKYDVTEDYPRGDVEDYRLEVDSGQRKPATVVRATFLLEELELQPLINDFGKGILRQQELTLSKGYDNTLYVGLDVDEKVAIASLVKRAQLPDALAKQLLANSTINDLHEAVSQIESEENKGHIDRLRTSLEEVEQQRGLTMFIYERYLKKCVPKFLYFDEYYQMRGHENIEALMQRQSQNQLQPSDHPLLGLISLARIKSLEELLKPQKTQELVNRLEGASNYLTKKILQYWSQNKYLQMRFDVRPARPGDPEGMTQGNNIWANVYDSKHFVTTRLGTRSRGFIWFFSFLAWFDQQQRTKEPLILLLDEPGLFLHGKAQADLLNYLEKELKDNHQVLYSTHSPFMVDPQHFERVRIVQDKTMDTDEELPRGEEGTKVLNDILEASEDSLFPLQGSLGYEIYQSLFVGPNSVVVEGASDLLYLQTMSELLHKQGRTGLDPRWTITPVGGADKVPTFVALLGAQKGLNIATLIDIQAKDRQSIENLYKRKLLKKKQVLTFGDFAGASEADIEDMFDKDFYVKLVNGEYGAELRPKLTESKLTSKSPRILVQLEEYFKAHPLTVSTKFSHYRPARYFAENIQKLASEMSPQTLERFEAAFAALNTLL